MQRVITEEILDTLSPDDSAAIRSRRDLRLINWFMGNKRWLHRQIAQLHRSSEKPLHLIEIGAGDGSFLQSLTALKNISLLGLDLIEKPTSLPDSTAWISQDLFNLSPFPTKADHTNIVICNLILHHFSHEQLSQLSALFNKTDHLLTVEPHRATLPQLMGRLSFPLFNHVTRHDMIASIKAGFQKNEMALYFKDWDIITETIDPKGGLRLHLSQLAPNDISS